MFYDAKQILVEEIWHCVFEYSSLEQDFNEIVQEYYKDNFDLILNEAIER